MTKAIELIKKANNTKFIISKNGGIVLNVSLTIAILLGVFAFHVSAISLVVALLTGHRMRLEANNGDYTKVNEVLDKVHDNVDTLKKTFKEDDKTTS